MYRIQRDPFDYCPICGQRGARCKPAVYHAIDAANTRAANFDERADDPSFFRRDYVTRLADGFEMLSDDEIVEKYADDN